MISESDEDEQYTVHKVGDTHDVAPQTEVAPHPADETDHVPAASINPVSASPLARYYRLGTQQRHAFDEHMRRLREETQKSEREREFRQQHPFRPHRETQATHPHRDSIDISGSADTVELRTSAPATPHTEALHTSTTPVRPVFDRLAAQAAQLELRRRHREEQKRRAEAAALRDAFQPEINRNAPVYTDQLRHLEDVPVEDRLLHYGETVARERQRRQELKALEERAAAAAAAQGAGLVGGSLLQLDPAERRRLREAFEKRNAHFVESREQHRRHAQEVAAEAYSFQPQISATSAALDDARRREEVAARKAELEGVLSRSSNGTSVPAQDSSAAPSLDISRRSDALYAQAVAQQRQRTQSLSRVGNVDSARHGKRTLGTAGSFSTAAADEGEPLHQPHTNPNSDRWIANGPHRLFFEQGFLQRQALYEQVKEEETHLKAKQATQSGETSVGAGAAVATPQKVHTKELNERLYYSARKATEVAQRRRDASLNARECSFRPELAPGTQNVLQRLKATRDSDVVKRLTNTSRKKVTLDPEKEDLYAPSTSTRRSKSATARSKSSPPAPAAKTLEDEGKVSAAPSSLSPRRRVVVSRDQVEHFYQRQMAFLQERQDVLQERKEGEAVQELVECTFRPRTNVDRRDGAALTAGDGTGSAITTDQGTSSVTHVTGVSGFLERQKAARQRRAEHDELVRTMGLPRTRAGGSDVSAGGMTLLSPFTLQTSQRRRRTSCSPADQGAFPSHDNEVIKEDGSSPMWANALTTSERPLYDALAEAEQYPSTTSAPLFALPGYTQANEDDEGAVYFDGVEGYGRKTNNVFGEENVGMPRPSERQVRPTLRGESAETHRDRASLFSALSPNTFSGRSLGTRPPHSRAEGGADAERRHASSKPSALKTATAAELTSSAQRRKLKRTVSFVDDGSTASPCVGQRAFVAGSHVDPLRRSFR